MITPTYTWRFRAMRDAAFDVQDWLLMFGAVNLTWFGLSVTLIMLPPATAALYDLAYAAYRGVYPTPRRYLGFVRERLITGWIWGLANILLLVMAGVTIRFYAEQGTAFTELLRGVTIFITLLAVIAQFYLWPYMAIQEEPNLLGSLRNAAFTSMADPMLLILNGGLTLFILIPGIVVLAPMMLIVPVFLALVGTYSLVDWLVRQGIIEDPRERDEHGI